MADQDVYSREVVEALIANNRVDVHFQPIADLHDGVVVAYEALCRPAPDSGVTDIGGLFHSAERHGLIWELEQITRRTAIRAAMDWPHGTKIFLNSTPAVFADPRFLDSLTADLKVVPDLSPDRVVLEITELSENLELSDLGEQVKRLVSAGFQVALDDAGAGTSGLNRMMIMRPQWVKLDREFVRGIDRDTLRQNLVRFFVHYARLSGVQVLAEGIESATELETVTSLGVRFAQGYYLGRPASRSDAMNPRSVSDLRSRWAAVEAALPQESIAPTLFSICRPVIACPANASAVRASSLLANAPDAAGVVATEGSTAIGYCSRTALQPSDVHPKSTVRSLMSRSILCIPGAATINEALTQVIGADTETLGDPVVVMNGGQPVGIVRLRDILRIAATDGRLASSGRGGLTGLPDRARADQHLGEHLRRWGEDAHEAHRLHADVAFVDVRAFTDYNSGRGRVRGDQLIRELAELLSMTVVAAEPDAFLSHLGDDRFMLTAPAGRLAARLPKLIELFDSQQNAEPMRADHPARPTLRVLLLTRAIHASGSCRDIYRLEQQLRERIRENESRTDGSGRGSTIVVHDAADANLNAAATLPARRAA